MEFKVGDHVSIHPATDAWMMGDRYGVVKSVGSKYVHVSMNTSGRTLKFRPYLLEKAS